MGGWTENLSSLLAVGPRPPTVPCRAVFLTWAGWGEEPERECDKTEVMVFYNLILEVASCHLCHILFVRNKSLDPNRTQGWAMTRDVDTGRWMSLGANVEDRTQDTWFLNLNIYVFSSILENIQHYFFKKFDSSFSLLSLLGYPINNYWSFLFHNPFSFISFCLWADFCLGCILGNSSILPSISPLCSSAIWYLTHSVKFQSLTIYFNTFYWFF